MTLSSNVNCLNENINISENTFDSNEDDLIYVNSTLNHISEETSAFQELSVLTNSNENLCLLDKVIAILTTFYNTNITQTALAEFLSLMNFLREKQAEKPDIPDDFDKLAQFIMKSSADEIDYDRTFYCDVCILVYQKLKDISTRVCPICKSSLSTYFHINIKKQIQRIFSEITVNERSHSNNTSVLKDISDGRIYKKALNEEKSTRSSIFTFSIKTDGISLCERSQLMFGRCLAFIWRM